MPDADVIVEAVFALNNSTICGDGDFALLEYYNGDESNIPYTYSNGTLTIDGAYDTAFYVETLEIHDPENTLLESTTARNLVIKNSNYVYLANINVDSLSLADSRVFCYAKTIIT